MKNIVYFLGAGFSAPLGLPVMSNFIFKSKDQFFENTEKYSYFEDIFHYIDKLSKSKNFMNVNLFNIEEIFSIAEMHKKLKANDNVDLEGYIKDVIEYHTPTFEPSEKGTLLQNFDITKILTKNSIYNSYILFIARLCGVQFRNFNSKEGLLKYDDFSLDIYNEADVKYRIITLNYDKIVENSVSFLSSYFNKQDLKIEIAKLHGSVDSHIIAPSWAKNIDETMDAWNKAALWLSEANEIRILGYSLPVTDSYIKHLFSTAFIESKNLQYIDILSLDPTGNIEKQYEKNFIFQNYKFRKYNIKDYLNQCCNFKVKTGNKATIYENVEDIHNKIFHR